MTPSSRVVRDEVNNLLDYLLLSEIALHRNPVLHEQGRVSWRPFPTASSFLETRDSASLACYKAWLVSGEYSALLFDGALLQITYDFAGHELVAHRLAWVPCPFAVDLELLQVESPIEVLDMYASGSAEEVVLSSTVRFDFDLENAAANHPASHMTINSTDCRIACAAPLRLGHFIDFVFRHFYPGIWHLHPFLDKISRHDWGDHTVTEQQKERLHVAWRA